MTKIGLLSDTHGFLDNKIFNYFASCDEIWHAGDIGNFEIIKKLKNFKKLKAVYGNIDYGKVRDELKEYLFFEIEKTKILLIHIGGQPAYYNKKAKKLIVDFKPDLFVCGHSHILKIMFDKKYNLLYLNPGAAGNFGPHNIRTALRFCIEDSKVKNMEVIELGNKEIFL